MSVLVIEHHKGETAGRVGVLLRDHGFRLDVCRVWNSDALPPDLDDVDGIVSLGGPMDVSDAAQHPWMKQEMELIREAHARQMAIVGICLGCQIVAEALGGSVAPMQRNESTNPEGLEIGWHDVKLTFPGTVESILTGIPWTHRQFHWHGCEVTALPPDATPLASSARCKNQAFRAGLRTFGFQFHFEVERDDIERWSRQWTDQRERFGLGHGELLRLTDACFPEFERLSTRLCKSLATYVFGPVVRSTRSA